MTFDANVVATWGEALAQLRDKLGGMVNWSVKDDSSAGAPQLAEGDWFVVTTALGEDIRVIVNGGAYYGGRVQIQHGPNWDAVNNVWADRYANDIFTSEADDNYGAKQYYAPRSDSNAIALTDAGTYWLEYVDGAGFAFYFQRQVGDGFDRDFLFGAAELAKTWDYTLAAARESQYSLRLHSTRRDRFNSVDRVRSWRNFMSAMPAAESLNTHNGQGMHNPDANYDNYPITDNVVCSAQYKNGAGNDAIIGTHNLWVNEGSGAETAHKDTVQEAGVNIYSLMKAHTVSEAIRMD